MKDRKRDMVIIEKVIRYCDEIAKTHDAFNHNKELFFNKEDGFIYRNSITMPILQIGELVKNLSEEFVTEHNSMVYSVQVLSPRPIIADSLVLSAILLYPKFA